MPDRLSIALSSIVTEPLTQSEDETKDVTGAWRSMSNGPADVVVTLPALSETLAVTDWSSPSPCTGVSAGQSPSTPDRLSSQVQATVTSPLYHPAAFGSVVATPDRVGEVVSTLMCWIVAVAVLPTLSTASPLTDCSAPSPTETGVGPQVLMPEPAVSSQAKLTVTALLFQPLPFAAGVRLPLIVGSVVSTRIVMTLLTFVSSSTLPARSALQKVTVWTPSSVSTNGSS